MHILHTLHIYSNQAKFVGKSETIVKMIINSAPFCFVVM